MWYNRLEFKHWYLLWPNNICSHYIMELQLNLSICLSVCLSVYLSIYLSLYIYIHVYTHEFSLPSFKSISTQYSCYRFSIRVTHCGSCFQISESLFPRFPSQHLRCSRYETQMMNDRKHDNDRLLFVHATWFDCMERVFNEKENMSGFVNQFKALHNDALTHIHLWHYEYIHEYWNAIWKICRGLYLNIFVEIYNLCD